MGKQDSRRGEALAAEINETKVPVGVAAVWFLGQESIVIKGGDTILYVDPYVSDLLERKYGAVRTYQPPMRPEHITNANYYLITHDHLDHLDPGTVEVVAKTQPQTTFIAPAYCREQLLELGVAADNLIDARADAWIEGNGVRIKPIPAAHEQLEEDEALGHRFVGYVIEINGITIYHAGDTTVYPGLVERLQQERIDLGMLPINGRDAFRNARGLVGNLDYREAAELAATAGFDMVIPLHYDVFAGNSEHPGYFVDYMYDLFPEQKMHVMARGERFYYVKSLG